MGYTSLLLKTGQTTKYVDGDDGDLELGAARSYTVLNTGQYSGTTNITLEGQTESHTNNCVQDNSIGLMWQMAIAGAIGAGDGKGGYTNYFPWTTNGGGIGIWTYLAAAKAANLSGHNDWRIPNKNEANSIIDCESLKTPPEFSPSITEFWTSTGTNNAIKLGANGLLYTIKTDVSFVLLVRGAPTAPPAGGNNLISGMVG